MKEKVGEVFSIQKDNQPIPGCTISKQVSDNVLYFSLAKNTDISAEIYPTHKLWIVAEGKMEVYSPNQESIFLTTGQAMITEKNSPVGVRTKESAIYTEINVGGTQIMNEAIKAGEVFQLAELLPYQEGKIINMDVVSNDKMKFVIMSFDAGTGLSEHAAPGEALIFALDGEGIIGYEGKEYPIQKGENFHFAKGGLHYVKADQQFKMALLLTLE